MALTGCRTSQSLRQKDTAESRNCSGSDPVAGMSRSYATGIEEGRGSDGGGEDFSLSDWACAHARVNVRCEHSSRKGNRGFRQLVSSVR